MKLLIFFITFPAFVFGQTTYDKTQNIKITELRKTVSTLVTANGRKTTEIRNLKKSITTLSALNTKNISDIIAVQSKVRKGGDSALKATVASLSKSVSNLKEQVAGYKAITDSLKKVITTNTIKVDTTSGSDFSISKSIMSINKANLNRTINIAILKRFPVPNTMQKKKKK